MNVQIIEKNGKSEWVVIPFSEYKKLQEALEDAEDISERTLSHFMTFCECFIIKR